MDLVKQFGERLKELRIEKNLSIRQLAKVLDVSDRAVGRWEKGQITPSIVQLYNIAIYFGVSADYLLGLEN